MAQCEVLNQQKKQLQQKSEILRRDLKEVQAQLQEHETLYHQTQTMRSTFETSFRQSRHAAAIGSIYSEILSSDRAALQSMHQAVDHVKSSYQDNEKQLEDVKRQYQQALKEEEVHGK